VQQQQQLQNKQTNKNIGVAQLSAILYFKPSNFEARQNDLSLFLTPAFLL